MSAQIGPIGTCGYHSIDRFVSMCLFQCRHSLSK